MKKKNGFLLFEASITYLILALGVVALAPLFTLSVRTNQKNQYVKVCTQLSQELMEEILLHRWDEKTPVPAVHITTGSTLGIDTGETAGDKRTFDDIDDFDNWSEIGARDPMMNALNDFANYNRQVDVFYVNASNTQVTGPTDFKEIHVCTTYLKMSPVCLDTLVTNR